MGQFADSFKTTKTILVEQEDTKLEETKYIF